MARKFSIMSSSTSNSNARWAVCTTGLGTSERCCRLPVEWLTEMLTAGVRSESRPHSVWRG